MQHNFIAIEGNIGAGKTTVARMLAEHYNARLLLEQFEDNPYLANFYREPGRYAFQLELSFLAERYQQLKDSLPNMELFRQITITDYVFDKSMIFARVNLDESDFMLYSRLFGIIHQTLPPPDLLLYLHNSYNKTMGNILKRGRSYEKSIPEEYLNNIHNSYIDFFKQHPDQKILIIDTEGADFIQHKTDFDQLLAIIEQDHEPGMSYFKI